MNGGGALKGCKYFPFREDPFSVGNLKQLRRVASPESVSIPLKLSSKMSILSLPVLFLYREP